MAGPMIQLSTKTGVPFRKTTAHLQRMKQNHILTVLSRYGPVGVAGLQGSTPVESGETANSWYYKVGSANGWYYLEFHNSHVENGVPIAILIQYGHGTRTGGYVIGRDYINPIVVPLFEKIKKDVVKEVTKL